MNRAHRLICASATVLLCSQSASAFSVMSSFNNGCHEGITLSAYFQTRELNFRNGSPVTPPNGVWEEVADYLLSELDVDDSELESQGEKFLLFSLLVGVRAPDTEGFTTINLVSLRAIHASPKGQYDHCLRAPEDDGNAGNIHAWEGCQKVLDDQMALAKEALAASRSENRLKTTHFSLDFYGTFDVKVWGPAYHLGRAVHLLQDSFSHTVRTADLRQIVHVMNYAEAIEGTLKVDRDGLPHSKHTDRCDHEVYDTTFAAIEATADLLKAACEAFDSDKLQPGTYLANAVIGKWLTMSDAATAGECTDANDYCDSPWTANARKDPDGPVLGACAVVNVGAPCRKSPIAMLLLFTFGAILLRRRGRLE